MDALGAVTGVWEDAPAGDFDFTAAGTDRVPPMRGRWITAPVIAASAGAPWFARGVVLARRRARDRPRAARRRSVRTFCTSTGTKAAEGSAATARMIDIRPHVQRGPNVLAVAMLAPEPGETTLTQAQAEADGLFAQVFVRQRPAASAGIRIAAVSGRAWRTARAESGGWEAPGFDDRGWTRAVERHSSPAPENDQANALARALTSAPRLGRTRAAARALRDPLTTALGRPSREQVVTSRAVPATTLQALELLNGETLADRIRRGADALVAARHESAGALIDRRLPAGARPQAHIRRKLPRAATARAVGARGGSRGPAVVGRDAAGVSVDSD